MTELEVQKRLQDKGDFPPLSEVAEEIVQLAQELSVPVHEVAAMLRTDPSLLQKMLAVLNAPFYRFIRPATNLDQAISFLGYKKICSLAVGLSILGRFPTTWESDFSYREFWERGLCTAVASCEITGQLTNPDLIEEPFTLGLIQDVGYLVLSYILPL